MSKKIKNNLLGKLFGKLDKILIIDKSIDFILIFVGLLAALAFENYIADEKIKDEYIDNLTRLHTEINNNLNFSEIYLKSSRSYFQIANDILELTVKGANDSYSGIFNISDADPIPFEYKVYKSLNNENFLNKSLYSEIIHIYDLKRSVELNFQDSKKSIGKLNYQYFNLYANKSFGTLDLNQIYVELNHENNKVTKSLPKLQSTLEDVILTSERILKAIEFELKSYETNIDESRSYSDLYWLSYNNNIVENYDKSISFARKGAKDIQNNYNVSIIDSNDMEQEYISYYGRLNMLIVGSYVQLSKTDSSNFNYDSTIISHLFEWEKTKIYNEMCQIYFCDYFYENKNFREFKKHLQQCLKSKKGADMLLRNVQNWKEFSINDTILNLLVKSKYNDRKQWIKNINPENYDEKIKKTKENYDLKNQIISDLKDLDRKLKNYPDLHKNWVDKYFIYDDLTDLKTKEIENLIQIAKEILNNVNNNNIKEEVTEYFENSKVKSKVKFLADVHGEPIEIIQKTLYYQNGNIEIEENYSNNLQNGIQKKWYENGNIDYIISFKDGIKSGSTEYYFENGNKQSTMYYLNGELNGQVISYYESGKKSGTYNYKNGILHGDYQKFNSVGDLIYETQFLEGTGIAKIFNEKGNIIEIRIFENGEIINKDCFDLNGTKKDC